MIFEAIEFPADEIELAGQFAVARCIAPYILPVENTWGLTKDEEEKFTKAGFNLKRVPMPRQEVLSKIGV